MAARNRSTQMIAAGVAMFLVAAALAVLALRGNDNNDNRDNASADAPTVTVKQVAESTPAQPATDVKIPNGKEALEVQLPAVQGIAGYAKTGDRVNVYGTFKDRQPNSPAKGVPMAKLILSNVEVLAATNNGTNATYVLAVNPNEAEQVIYLSSFEGIWLTLTRDGAPSVGGTAGRNASNVS